MNSGPEAASAGKNYNWAFIAEFKNREDLEYYVAEDPVHDNVKKLLAPLINDVFVYDFEY